jgi:hypothetical protein
MNGWKEGRKEGRKECDVLEGEGDHWEEGGGSGEGSKTCLWCVEREACVRIDNHKDVADVRLRSA